MSDKKQIEMFGEETLPLFSGTPVPGDGSMFRPAPAAPRQLGMFKCGACRDTGMIENQYCWCDAGQRARGRNADKNSNDAE